MTQSEIYKTHISIEYCLSMHCSFFHVNTDNKTIYLTLSIISICSIHKYNNKVWLQENVTTIDNIFCNTSTKANTKHSVSICFSLSLSASSSFVLFKDSSNHMLLLFILGLVLFLSQTAPLLALPLPLPHPGHLDCGYC